MRPPKPGPAGAVSGLAAASAAFGGAASASPFGGAALASAMLGGQRAHGPFSSVHTAAFTVVIVLVSLHTLAVLDAPYGCKTARKPPANWWGSHQAHASGSEALPPMASRRSRKKGPKADRRPVKHRGKGYEQRSVPT